MSLKGSLNLYDYDITTTIEENLRSMFEYGLIKKQGFTKTEFANTATSGFTMLQATTDPNYTDGQIYEGMGPSWVWQSGASNQIFQVSGVYIDNVFYDTSTSGANAFTIDYRNGRVIFDTARPDGTQVECEYVFNDVAVYLSDDEQWRTIIDAYTTHYPDFANLDPSGVSAYMKEQRAWLPCIVIDEPQKLNSTGMQLGGGEIDEFEVIYHIFAEDPFLRNKLVDIISNQVSHVINFYNINTAPYPYLYDGSLNPSGIEHPSLSNQNGLYFLTHVRVDQAKGRKRPSTLNLMRGEVRQILEIFRYPRSY